MGPELNVFTKDDFDTPQKREFFVPSEDRSSLAEHCNKLLSERLVKYYGNPNNEPGYWVRGNDPFYTHIIYGLEPQPIPKEPVKKEITREDLARAWDSHAIKSGLFRSDESEIFKYLCKELGYE